MFSGGYRTDTMLVRSGTELCRRMRDIGNSLPRSWADKLSIAKFVHTVNGTPVIDERTVGRVYSAVYLRYPQCEVGCCFELHRVRAGDGGVRSQRYSGSRLFA